MQPFCWETTTPTASPPSNGHSHGHSHASRNLHPTTDDPATRPESTSDAQESVTLEDRSGQRANEL